MDSATRTLLEAAGMKANTVNKIKARSWESWAVVVDHEIVAYKRTRGEAVKTLNTILKSKAQ
jgi:hypothetical protein